MAIRVLAICPTHNATATLLVDGAIVGIVSEERFTRNKNQSGFPKHAVAWLLTQNNVTLADIDAFAITGEHWFNTTIASVTSNTTANQL